VPAEVKKLRIVNETLRIVNGFGRKGAEVFYLRFKFKMNLNLKIKNRMKKILVMAFVAAMFVSCKNTEKGEVITTEQYQALNQSEANNGKRFALVGYPFIGKDIEVKGPLANDSQLPHIDFYEEPGGQGKLIASLPIANGTGKNEFDAPGTFTMDQVVFYDNEGAPLKYTDKMQVSFTMELQVERGKTTSADKSVYYGGPSDVRIDKAN